MPSPIDLPTKGATYKQFTVAGTFTYTCAQTGMYMLSGCAGGGGGGGGYVGGAANGGGGGGGAGWTIDDYPFWARAGDVLSVVVGAAGAAGAAGAIGGAGGDSYILRNAIVVLFLAGGSGGNPGLIGAGGAGGASGVGSMVAPGGTSGTPGNVANQTNYVPNSLMGSSTSGSGGNLAVGGGNIGVIPIALGVVAGTVANGGGNGGNTQWAAYINDADTGRGGAPGVAGSQPGVLCYGSGGGGGGSSVGGFAGGAGRSGTLIIVEI